MKKLLLLVCCLFILPVHAASWVQISDDEYIDADSVQNYVDDYGNVNYRKKAFWKKTINNGNDEQFFQTFKDIDKVDVQSVNTRLIIDYTNKTIAIKSSAAYDKNGYTTSSYSFRDSQIEWRNIIPDSRGEEYYNLVKKPKQLKKIYKWQQENLRE